MNIISEAKSWVGTPYHHQARIKGVGVDCANLIAGIFEECGFIPINLEPYSLQWHLHNKEEKMINILLSYGCLKVDTNDPSPGQIITFQMGKVSGHIGIMVDNERFIHADIYANKVVEVTFGGVWKRRLSGVFNANI